MTKYHLLGWIFKAMIAANEEFDLEGWLDNLLEERHFIRVNAPDWVYPAFKERLKAFKESPDFK